MASLYKRSGSEFWWIKYRKNGELIRESTKFRRNVPMETRHAQALMHRLTIQELETSRVQNEQSRWEVWVPDFLQQRYENSMKTFARYSNSWHNLYTFLQGRQVFFPCQLQRQHCLDYLKWRKEGHSDLGMFPVCHNTALHELKLLHLVMNEAIQRDFCVKNPAARLGIKKHKPAEKPEISDEDIHYIRTQLRKEPQWMQDCFEIGLGTGLRLRETNLLLKDVDHGRQTITVRVKGGDVFTTKFDNFLVPLFRRLKEQRGKDARALDMPRDASKQWWFFFRRIRRPQYCFHCLRVTFITRGARAGVPEAVMMKLAHHASETIHRVYMRLSVEDTGKYLAMFSPPPSPTESSEGALMPPVKVTSIPSLDSV